MTDFVQSMKSNDGLLSERSHSPAKRGKRTVVVSGQVEAAKGSLIGRQWRLSHCVGA